MLTAPYGFLGDSAGGIAVGVDRHEGESRPRRGAGRTRGDAGGRERPGICHTRHATRVSDPRNVCVGCYPGFIRGGAEPAFRQDRTSRGAVARNVVGNLDWQEGVNIMKYRRRAWLRWSACAL